MSHVSEEDELFASLEGLERASIDPELAVLLDLVAVAQKRIDDNPEQTLEIMAELNTQVPWMDERVTINGEAFGPRLNDNNELQNAFVSYNDEPVVFRGFKIVPSDLYVDAVGGHTQGTIAYLFLVQGFTQLSKGSQLAQQKNDLFAVAYIDKMHVHPERASPSYYANVAREYASPYFEQLESIAASSHNILEVVYGLSTMRMKAPKDDIEGEGLYALSEYAYSLLRIDKNLPYDVEIEGSYFTNANLDMFGETEEYDKSIVEDTGDVNVVGHTEGDKMRFLAGIEKLEPGPIPVFIDNDVTPSKDLYWTLDLTLFGKDPSEDHVTRLGVPTPHVKDIISIRQQHVESKIT